VEKIQKALEKARQQRAKSTQLEAFGQQAEERSAPTRRTDVDAITYSQTRVIAASSKTLQDRRAVAGSVSHDGLADTFRILRTRVLHRLDAKGHRSLAITSPNRGDGKTLTAVNLALSLAMHVDRTVLLADFDLRRPSVHTYFGMQPNCGLADYLLNGAPLSTCLINPGIDRFVILPVGTPLPGSSEMLSSPKMVGLVRELKSRYPDRIIIYDLPPVLVSDEALAFLHQADSCLLVVQEGATRKVDIERTLELIRGCNLIGTVLNKSAEKSRTAHYYTPVSEDRPRQPTHI
jgi:capsular exopolysaccharide synthesis family protein